MGIADTRKAKGMTQMQLATKTGLSQSVIAAYETGRRSPSPKAAARLALALEIKSEDVWRVLYAQETKEGAI